MEQASLFGGKDGFRLESLEIFNWGTFTSRVWSVECGRGTSLLTGANGSGKSTVIDALLTLLVPPRRRTYNQALGTGSKRERTEQGYVLGVYGRVRGEDDLARKQYLRTKEQYSVLLARFGDEVSGATITLAQLFWFDRDQLHKIYLVSSSPLTIAEHFQSFKNARDLRQQLRKIPETELFQHFSEYSQRFRKLAGLESETALDLFNQTVSIKDIEHLDDFIRSHMLDRFEVTEQIAELKAHYDNLERAYQAIVRAREQLELLRPLVATIDDYETVGQALREIEELLQAVPGYFAARRVVLLKQAIEAGLERMREIILARETAEQGLAACRLEEGEIQRAIDRDDTAGLLRSLAQQLEHLAQVLSARQRRLDEFTETQKTFERSALIPKDEAEFSVIKQGFRDNLASAERELLAVLEPRDALVISAGNLKQELAEEQAELRSLEQRATQIPERNMRLRAAIADALQVAPTEIPFIGELLRVRPSEQGWEGAIERVLHNFGLRLLVTEELYERVNRYVKGTDLRGRVVYHRVSAVRDVRVSHEMERENLVYKVEVKQATPFTFWIENELAQNFSYHCTDDLNEFQRLDRALTSTGLVKGGRSLHEKDDRRNIHDRRSYILGWDNTEKIAALKRAIVEHGQKLASVEHRLNDLRRREERLRAESEAFRKLIAFESFIDLDTGTIRSEIAEGERKSREVKSQSAALRKLEQALVEVRERLKALDGERTRLFKEEGALEKRSSELEQALQFNLQVLEIYDEAVRERYFPVVEARIREELSLQGIDAAERSEREAVLAEQKKLFNSQRELQGRVERQMATYRERYPIETTEVDKSFEAAPEFRRFLRVIEEEDLPKHERRFKELLNDSVIRDVAHFKSILEREEEQVQQRIDGLNLKLALIAYSPSTFIRLNVHPTTDTEIRDFRALLKSCLPDVGRLQDEAENERCFHQIREVLNRLTSEERWARKVTDVRNWLTFSASELYESDRSERSFYSDSGGLSGGQKVKLAYTVLASAVAYQYGLGVGAKRQRSFRFVALDEAFGKIDDINSRYAMELFRNLHLQLLVATPLEKIHVVEPYISGCHFVDNNSEGSFSRIFNLTMDEFRLKREEFLKQHSVGGEIGTGDLGAVAHVRDSEESLASVS